MPDEQAIAAEVRAFVLSNLHTYTQRGDGALEKVVADFAPDVSFTGVGPDQEIHGLDELTAHLRHEFEQHAAPIALDVQKANVRVLGETLAVVETATDLKFDEATAMHLRTTFVCEKRPEGWRIVNLHGSLPTQPAPEELWPVDVLQARNAELEREVAERTAELERQNEALARAHRAAQIEAALERVRARTMAMHQSDELAEVVSTVFQELTRLDLVLTRASLLLIDPETLSGDWWMRNAEDPTGAEGFFVPYHDHPTYVAFAAAWKERNPRWVYVLDGETKASWDDLLFSQTGLARLPDVVQAGMRAPERVVLSASFGDFGAVSLASLEPLSDANLDILQRFARVFEQTYTRFLDIQRAEAQAREAQIEAALERVRARTMAMHRTDELREVIATVYEQFQGLGFDSWGCTLCTRDDARDGWNQWLSIEGAALPEPYMAPELDDPVQQRLFEAWRQDFSFQVVEFGGTEKEVYDRRLFSETDWKHFPEIVKAQMQAHDHVVCSMVVMHHSVLEVVGPETLPDEKRGILQRLARVFEQTYTRFLDLQQAEAQAREAEIEAALERVRARTMAMHKSEELGEVAIVLYKELIALGLTPFYICGYVDVDEKNETQHVWMTNPEGGLREGHSLPLVGDAVLQDRYEAWKRQDPVFYQELHGDEIKQHLEFVSPYLGSTILAQNAEIPFPDPTIFYCSNIPHGYLHMIIGTLLSAEEESLLVRFTRVFEQTYTRFLDLKQAEAQAREAQIEAALERVRARTMAMHRSEELAETASVMFQQLLDLGIKTVACGLIIIDPEAATGEVWLSADGQIVPRSFVLHLKEDPAWGRIFAAWQSGDPLHVEDLRGETLIRHYRYLVDQGMPVYEFLEAAEASQSERLVIHAACFSHGCIGVNYTERLDEQSELLTRFARVFDQTYTRFLDLQRAEAQAREAEIEAALERVRSRAMAMQRSDELREVVSKVFEEFQRLDFGAESCCIGIFDEATHASDWWVASPSNIILPRSYRIPYLENWPQDWYQSVYNNWQQGVPFFTCSLEGEAKRAFDHMMLSETEFALIFQEDGGIEDIEPLESLILSYAALTYGVLEVGTTEPIPADQVSVLQRFARVIDLTYTRFDDLQQAEARAREAVRDASLDRVRAEIASMRTADDLERITPLVWRELTTLGVPFFRCGVFIMDEAEALTRAYLSTPEGRSLAVLHLPYDSDETTRRAVDYWREHRVYTDLWDRKQFAAWVTAMQEQGHLETREAYQAADEPPEQLALQFVPFTQGMLYVGSTAPLASDGIELVQALADAFAVAYARYEDFTRLEQAKARVEATLADLKATQAQLIHAEKMASLGQMTAGIAHEIKNPLNFVNNFSEIIVELSDELSDVLGPHLDASFQDGADDFRMILADLKVNAAQIVKHGRRADDIVRSMMQHAREGAGTREPTAINALVEEYVNLAYHGARASQPGFTVTVKRDYGEDVGQVPARAQEIGRVLLNLLGNAFDAVEKTGEEGDGETQRRGDAGTTASGTRRDTARRVLSDPTVTVTTRHLGETVEIRIADNGPGIPAALREKIFEPFFTTKPAGSGTGLGLSLSYDIVTQGHGGTLTVESEPGEGATFIVTLPAGPSSDRQETA